MSHGTSRESTVEVEYLTGAAAAAFGLRPDEWLCIARRPWGETVTGSGATPGAAYRQIAAHLVPPVEWGAS